MQVKAEHVLHVQQKPKLQHWLFVGTLISQHSCCSFNLTQLLGFNEGAKTWLPVHPNYQVVNVKSEWNNASSYLHLYKSLTMLRKSSKALTFEGLKTVVQNGNKVLLVVREESLSKDAQIVVLVVNFSEDEGANCEHETFCEFMPSNCCG